MPIATGKTTNHFVALTSFPDGAPKPSDFSYLEHEIDLDAPLNENELLLRNIYVTCDPYMRMRMKPDFEGYGGASLPARNVQLPVADIRRLVSSFEGPFRPDQPIVGYGVSLILKSAHPNYQAGQYISTVVTQWAEFQVLMAQEIEAQEAAKMMVKIDPEEKDVPLAYYVGPLGTSGVTAYVGLFEKGKPKRGETVLVSAAAGAVGQSVCIFAKEAGCRVVGVAGGKEKCERLIKDVGTSIRSGPESLRDVYSISVRVNTSRCFTSHQPLLLAGCFPLPAWN